MPRSFSRQKSDDGVNPLDAFLRTEDDLDDLLRPALGREDDARGMQPGYVPESLILGTMLGGIPFATHYLAKNAQAWRTRPGPGTIWALGLLGLFALILFHIFVPHWPRSTKRIVELGCPLAFLLLLARTQKRAFMIALSHGIEPLRLLPQALGVWLGSWALHLIIGLPLLLLAREFDIPTPGLRDRKEKVSTPLEDLKSPATGQTPEGAR
jgi:hypothetical protein